MDYEFRLGWAGAALGAHDRSEGKIEVRRGKDLSGRIAGSEQEWVLRYPPDLRGLEHIGEARDAVAVDAMTTTSEAQAARLRDLQLYGDFYAYVVTGREPESSSPRNLETLRPLDAIQRSTEHRQPVALRP